MRSGLNIQEFTPHTFLIRNTHTHTNTHICACVKRMKGVNEGRGRCLYGMRGERLKEGGGEDTIR